MTRPARKPVRRVTGLDRIRVELARHRKAIAGFISPGVGAIGYALLPGSPGGAAITTGELSGAAAAMLLGAVGVYLAPKNAGGR